MKPTQLVKVSVYPVAARHGADEPGLQEGGPLVHQAPVTPQVILQAQITRRKSLKACFHWLAWQSRQYSPVRYGSVSTRFRLTPTRFQELPFWYVLSLEHRSVLSMDHSSGIVQSRALLG